MVLQESSGHQSQGRDLVAALRPTSSRLCRAQMSDDVADQLRAAIMSKKLRAGTFIRLHQTAAELGVSITPIREALLKLTSEGLVQRQPHRGYVVLALTDQDVRDICWLRDTITAELSATTPGHIADEEIDELERINNELVGAVAFGDVESIAALELSFESVLARVSGRSTLTRLLLGAQRCLHARIDVADPEWGRAAIDSNRRLIAAYSHRGPSGTINPLQGSDADLTGRHSRTIGVGQLRSQTLSYFGRVAAGESIDITRRGSVTARIIPTEHRWSGQPSTAEADGVANRAVMTRVALDDLRTRAGHFLDRVAAGERLEVVHDRAVIAVVVRPEDH